MMGWSVLAMAYAGTIAGRFVEGKADHYMTNIVTERPQGTFWKEVDGCSISLNSSRYNFVTMVALLLCNLKVAQKLARLGNISIITCYFHLMSREFDQQ